MSRKARPVTEAELSILAELWERPTMTVRQLAEILYGSAAVSDLATVQKLLSRLEAKGCVARQRDCWPHVFHALVDREEMIHRRLQLTADELCDGALTPLLSHLVRNTRMSDKQRETLRDLINSTPDDDDNPSADK
jgi:predicted transcriptional regulator